jgi:catechol 2,3-dioxygenase-like lactoylglutathione lyase family enzyme
MIRLHHVNLTVPPGRSKPIAAFYRDVLGFTSIARPDNERSGAWLQMDDGTQLHLSEREGAAHPEQHFALMVDDLSAVRVRLGEAGAGFQPADDVFQTGGRGFTYDPAGNRIELIAKGPSERP